MKRLAFALIALGILVTVGVTLGFHSYTDDFYMVQVLNENADTGEAVSSWQAITTVDPSVDNIVMHINPETGLEEMVVRPPQWRPHEHPMHLDNMRIIVGISGSISLLGIILYIASQGTVLKKQDVFGLVFIVLGLLFIIGVMTVFYPCKEQMPAQPRAMRCVWTMRVLLAVSGAISASGAAMLLARSRELALGINIAVISTGIAFVMIPTLATGACPAHGCADGLDPFSKVMGCMFILCALFGAFLQSKEQEEEDDSVEETTDNF